MFLVLIVGDQIKQVYILGNVVQKNMHVGSVCDLRNIMGAIQTARLVMEHTKHTTLSGLQATAFALEMGMKLANLSTPNSSDAFHSWYELCIRNTRACCTTHVDIIS